MPGDTRAASLAGVQRIAAGCSTNRFRTATTALAVLAYASLLIAPAAASAKKDKPLRVEPAAVVSMAVPSPPQGTSFDVTISGSVTITTVGGGLIKGPIAKRCLAAQPLFVAVKQRDVGGGNERYADLRPPGSDGNPGNPTDPFDPQPVVVNGDGTFTGVFKVTIDDSYDPARQQWEINAEAFNYIGPPSVRFEHRKLEVRCFKAGTHDLPGTVLDTWHLVGR